MINHNSGAVNPKISNQCRYNAQKQDKIWLLILKYLLQNTALHSNQTKRY